MQEMTPEICAASSENETKQLRDVRDDKSYWVTKLKDGNCWMTQNLALGGSQSIALTPDDTNITSNWTLPASVPEGDWTGDPANPELYAYVLDYDDSTTKYGNFYNWLAAVAGTAVDSGNAPSSICPKGWRLPTGGSSGELKALYDAYNSNYTNFIVATSFVFSGHYYRGLGGQGDDGDWWSSTADCSSDAYYLRADSGDDIYPDYYDGKFVGFSVRCVASGS